VQNHPFDVILVGAGAAGLYTALCLPQDWQVALINKDDLSLSASDWAQGGIAAVTSRDDSPRLHWEDTLRAGAGLCDRRAVQLLVDEAADCVNSLVELGVAFDRKGTDLALTREAAHSRPRVLHAADTTGRAIVSTLAEQVLGRSNITVLNRTIALDLWLNETRTRCVGVQVFEGGKLHWIAGRAGVFAPGGGGQVFAHTTNPQLSTGDGVAMAHRAGATLRDLEFFQFHPTALMVKEAPRFLISEAVRGEGAQVFDQQGDRFLLRYHPDGELAPRDIVSRSIFQHLSQYPDQDYVHLDLRSIPPDRIQYRFPTIIKVCQQWNINLFKEPIPVSPAAHYWMGGVLTDFQGQTSLPGLYAVGEAASTGVHGANRLASNSLLECLVFGRRLAHLDRTPLPDLPQPVPPAEAIVTPLPLDPTELDWIKTLRQDLPQLIWKSAGICRTAAGMQEALNQIELWSDRWQTLGLSQDLRQYANPTAAMAIHFAAHDSYSPEQINDILRSWLELGNLLEIAALILRSALFREESRGGHYRLDFAEPREEWLAHTLVNGEVLSKSLTLDNESAQAK
jgi:L-aspartate oxidase